ncbi:MAG: hypothetical protein IPK81_11650 [Rhodospirillales bacterium]|nr:MAG: hypothetical protein IPK81_11650 [Rhodospirillales bacterium]
MEIALGDVVNHITRGAGIVALYVGALWKGDDMLSEAGRKHLYATLADRAVSPSPPVELMARYFGPTVPIGRFVLNNVVFSAAAVGVLAILYVSSVAGFWTTLRTDPDARSRFLAQFLGNGLLVVVVVNHVCFAVHGWLSRSVVAVRENAVLALTADIALRVSAFCAATAVTYVLFARFGGAFKGNETLALNAVGPTLLGAANFGNLTSVYLYATAISAFPLFVSATVALMGRVPAFSLLVRRVFFFLPFEGRPVRAMAAVLGVFVAIFGALVTAVAARL